MRHFVLRTSSTLALVAGVALSAPGCGGGGGGKGPDGAGQGLALVTFLQNGVNNVSLNQILEFRFSEPIEGLTVNSASFQVREGPSFGRAVTGFYRTVGSTVFFEPTLPGLCDLSDAGFQPGKTYRVTLVGYPEQFAIQNTVGQPLRSTMNFEFRTREDTDPQLFIDQIPATAPHVVMDEVSPLNGSAVVQVHDGNALVVPFSENIDPCSIISTNVIFQEWAHGGGQAVMIEHPPGSGTFSGFDPPTDTLPDNPFSWGSGTPLSPPQTIRATLKLVQSFSSTVLTVTPEFGSFPEDALCVLELTFGIKDLGGTTLSTTTIAFTTENLDPQDGEYVLRLTGETPIDTLSTTADVNTARSPGRAQAWFGFSGDGDNGINKLIPSGPNAQPACVTPLQPNDGIKDAFDTLDYAATFVSLDTGLTINAPCTNQVDGSRAVVWEFTSFRIRAGRRVYVVGNNPAIFRIQGAVQIDGTGTLNVRGFGTDGVVTSNGGIGNQVTNAVIVGGRGYAGGGSGGTAYWPDSGRLAADPGFTGYGSPSGQAVAGGTGAGGPGSFSSTAGAFGYGAASGGGGGGHSAAGSNGSAIQHGSSPFKTAAMGTGGALYGSADMAQPSAGSGGGAGGSADLTSYTATFQGGGGSGGGGGGFVEFAAGGLITVNGRIDATGGNGGQASTPPSFYTGGGGGGGGSGGGVCLFTPSVANVSGATITTAGGAGGASFAMPGTSPNPGGAGATGRIAIEDGDGTIDGLASATLVPAPLTLGFHSGPFDPGRFPFSLSPVLVTGVFFAGPANPTYEPPVAADFVVAIPQGSDRGPNATAMVVEAQGFDLLPDGTYDPLSATGWKTVGYFKNSGVADAPTWEGGTGLPGDVPVPPGNTGGTIGDLDGSEFLQVRVSFHLPGTIGPADPGPYLDDWTIRFKYDQ